MWSFPPNETPPPAPLASSRLCKQPQGLRVEDMGQKPLP